MEDPELIAERFILQVKNWREIFVDHDSRPEPLRYLQCRRCKHHWVQKCPVCDSKLWKATKHPEVEQD